MKQFLQHKRKTLTIALALLCLSTLALSVATPVIAKPPDGDDGKGNGKGNGQGQGQGQGQGSQGASNSAPQGKAKGHNVPVNVTWTLNITASGTAFNITDQSLNTSAQVTFNATVEKSSMGRAKLNVTVGNVTIGGTDYPIVNGKGHIAIRGGKLIMHLRVTGEGGATLPIVLKGNFTESLKSLSTIDNYINVTFLKPQSKLAAEYFLELTGNITRTA